MRSYYIAGFSMLAGVAIGASAIQSLHAQAKKVYTVTELETLDPKLAVPKAADAAGVPESAPVPVTTLRPQPDSLRSSVMPVRDTNPSERNGHHGETSGDPSLDPLAEAEALRAAFRRFP